MNFWDNTHNELIERFNTSEDIEDKNRYFTLMYDVLTKLIDISCRTYKVNPTEDIVQDCLIRLYTKIIPAIINITTSLQFIYISLKRYILSYHLDKNKYTLFELDECKDELDIYNDNNIEQSIQRNDNRTKIMNYFNQLEPKQLNRYETIFILKLKEYLINNEYETKGFKNFFIKELNINDKYTFKLICSNLSLSALLFDESRT